MKQRSLGEAFILAAVFLTVAILSIALGNVWLACFCAWAMGVNTEKALSAATRKHYEHG